MPITGRPDYRAEAWPSTREELRSGMATTWITGASSGIGRALALALARRGDTVIATARRADELRNLADEAGRRPGRIHVAPGDVADAQGMQAVVAAAEGEVGPIDVAVLNAGIYLPVEGASFDAAAFRKCVDVNLIGVANGLAAVLPRMVAGGRGRVALMGSLAGYGGVPASAAYGASKAGLINLAASLRMDLAPLGVIVQVINPGFIATERNAANGSLPFLMPLDAAVDRIVAGLETERFEIAFPRRFALMLKGLNLLPYPLYFSIVSRFAGPVGRRRSSRTET
jgi:NAD(P)-dependent dehydrogenase (short-subunit alcohol dehydrogenase family)